MVPIWMLVVPVVIFGVLARRGRWGRMRWDRWHARGWMDDGSGAEVAALAQELEAQRAYTESLETRLMQLEERLDFTERVLASGRDRERASS